MEILRQRRFDLTLPITILVLGGLCVIADLRPMTAIFAGGAAAAMLVNLGRGVSVRSADALGLLFISGLIFWGGVTWSSVVMVSSLGVGLFWLRLSLQRMEGDDRIYLPSLAIVLGIGALYVMGNETSRIKEDFLTFSGLTGAADQLNDLIRDGAEQVSGESREEYLKMTQEFMTRFPYYYFGTQTAFFALIFNMIQRLQRSREIMVSHFLLFKIKERYVFLLIFGMGIEIFRYFLDRKELLYFSRSIFVFLGVTYFMAGLAVIGFLILAQRLKSNSFLSRAFTFALIFIIIIKPVICSAIGLLDIWFDFRKTKTIPGGGLNS